MDRRDLRSAFDGVKADLVQANVQALPGEAQYFLNHQARFFHDFQCLAQLEEPGLVLEVGAYPFFFTALLSELGHSVVAVDLDPMRSADFIGRQKLKVVACNVGRLFLPFADCTFDRVMFNEILEHLRIDPLLALSEAQRVLKPEGLLLLTTPNLYFIKTVLKFLAGRGFIDPVNEFGKLRQLGHMGHIREYSPREVKRFLQVSGFQVLRHEFKQFNYPRSLFGLAARPVLALAPMLRGDQTVVARKQGDGPNLWPVPA